MSIPPSLVQLLMSHWNRAHMHIEGNLTKIGSRDQNKDQHKYPLPIRIQFLSK